MEKIQFLFLIFITAFFTACSDDDAPQAEATGDVRLQFAHFVGSVPLQLQETGSTNYNFMSAAGGAYNLNMFGYYVSEVKLEGPNGESFAYPMNVSPNAAEVTGYYHVKQSEPNSQFITLNEIPAGTYDRISYTIGIQEEGVQEGAAGGVLDPASGAWFWNWNAGYIAFAVEGTAENSGQPGVVGDGFSIPEKNFALHVGGWKEVVPAEGDEQKFFNNNQQISLPLGSNITVSETATPTIHIVADVAEVLNSVNFATNFAVHSPKAGRNFAPLITDVFNIDHVHQ